MTLRKIGGIYWFSIGRLRIAFCWTRPKRPSNVIPFPRKVA